jgi:hypothetical protein
MQIKNKLLILFLASWIGNSTIAQRTEMAIERKIPARFAEATSSFALCITQPDPANLVFRIFLNNPESKKITIKVSKETDIELTSQSVSTDYVCDYNLDQLGDGNYTFVVSDGKEKLEKGISIRTIFNVTRVSSFVSGKKDQRNAFK